MFTNRLIATFLAIALSAAPLWAQAQTSQQTPSMPAPSIGTLSISSSPATAAADRFWDLGYEVAHTPNITGPQADQGIILLTAARSLNSQIVGVEPLLLKLASRHTPKDYSEPMIFWLDKYVGPSADRVIVADAIRSLVDRLSSPDERKAMLERVALKIKNRNAAIDSDLATSLGLVMLEKGVSEQAKFYLVQAYNNNKFNRTAYAKLLELTPREIGPAANLEHLRLLVRENPLDIKAALAYAGYAERLGLYDVAAQSYVYCVELFRYLYPSDPLPQHIYLPFAMSCYNAPQGLELCIQTAASIRDENRFDILLEALAGKAALKLGRTAEAQQIFQQAEQHAEELLTAGPGQPQPAEQAGVQPVRPPSAKHLAWFYSFADVNPAKALDWANKAYSAEPNSPAAGALLAYALCLNNQVERAQPLSASGEQGQTTDLVRARIQLAAGNKPDAIQTLKNAIAKDAGSLSAEKGKELLRELGSPYFPEVDPRPLVGFLYQQLGKAYVPQFLPPDQMLDVQFTLRGADFSYGNEIEGAVAITNKSPEPLIISDNSLFQGNLRVTARVTGGIQREIRDLVSETIRTTLAIAPGRSLVHPLRLSTGELREILLTYPQASLEIQFTLYLDAVATDQGGIANRLVDLKPVTVKIARPPLKITAESLMSRSRALASGPESQRIQTALWFTGLLKEDGIMRGKVVLYDFQTTDWLPGHLRQSLTSPTGLLQGGADGDWAVKVSTLANMLSLPLDQELANAVARRLSDPQWPVRLMAVYLLANNSGGSFGNVLDWVAQNDKDDLVRSLAISLQSAPAATAVPSWPGSMSVPVAPR